MIIVHLTGGIGNQMFQYALGRTLAEKNSTLLKLDLSGFESYKLHRYALHCFNIWEHIATIDEINAFRRAGNPSGSFRWMSRVMKKLGILPYSVSDFYENRKYIKQTQRTFDPSILEANGNIYLEGYWQTEKYFIEIIEILHREFICKYVQDKNSKELAEKIQSTNAVSLHIRRGDYVSNPKTNQAHGLATPDYYENAIKLIIEEQPDSHFYIFSDDHSWVAENFKPDYPVTMVDHNNASRNYEDMRLMSLCDHHIIANSSFSWWGAWLGTNPEKIVVAPQKWFNDTTRDTRDLIPTSWVRL